MLPVEATLITFEQVMECSIVQRLNRFVVEVHIGKEPCLAWINNTGRLEEFLVRGRRAFCLPRPPTGKTQCRLFAIRDGSSGALIDTQFQMRAFERCLREAQLSWLTGCREFRRNARLGQSLIDYLVQGPGGEAYVEVKSAVLRHGRYAMYPDCPSVRGRRHVRELMSLATRGDRAFIVFVAALAGVQAFQPNRAGDEELTVLLGQAQQAGVDIRAVGMFYDPQATAVKLYDPDLPVVLPPG